MRVKDRPIRADLVIDPGEDLVAGGKVVERHIVICVQVLLDTLTEGDRPVDR